MKKQMVVSLVLMAVLASVSFAGVYTVAPTINCSVGSDSDFITSGAYMGSWWGPEWRNFEKFNIPVFAGETIVSVVANVNVTASANGGWNAGVYLDMRDNSWDAGLNRPVYTDAVVAGTRLENRAAYATPGLDGTPGAGDEVLGLISTDITSYFTQFGAAEGQDLSIRLGREIPTEGSRGARLGYSANANGVSLTITTIPEPATMVLLGLGGVASLIRRKK